MSKRDFRKKDEMRVGTTIPIWVFLVMMTIVLSFRMTGDDFIPIVMFTLMAGVLTTGFIWNWGRGESGSKKSRLALEDELYGDDLDGYGEKRKRDRLSQALSQLSDSQLMALREGIREGRISEDRLRDLLGEDGELLEDYQ